ncbi:TPA: hypothetical protein ACX6O4_000068 [Photobacterium damselae]
MLNVKTNTNIKISLFQLDLLNDILHELKTAPIKAPLNIRNDISTLITELTILINVTHESISFFENENERYYLLQDYNTKSIEKTLSSIINNKELYTLDKLLIERINNIHSIWIAVMENNDSTTTNKLKGYIDQLYKRQSEINSNVKNINESIRNISESEISRIEREAKRQTNRLNIQAKEYESKILNEVTSSFSKEKIKLQEEQQRLTIELQETINKNTDEAFESKKKIIIEHIDFKAESLLDKVKSDVDSLSERVSEQVNEFCILNDTLRKTLSYVSSDILADSSLKQAEQEKKTADNLRSLGIIWLMFSIILFILTFDYDKLIDSQGTPQYTLIILRSFFLVIGITPGFYLLRESARHRTDERRYRQKGIQLATIDGYFSEFESDERNRAKKELSKNYFHAMDFFVDSSAVDNTQTKYDKIFDKVISSQKMRNK